MNESIVIVGGGQAALAAATRLRERDKTVALTMICDEPTLPYQRPPLSKKYLSGEMPLDRLILRSHEWFEENDIVVRTGVRADAIDREQRAVALSDGQTLSYDKLLLATGSVPRRLPDNIGGGLDGVFTLRSTTDSDAIRPYLKDNGNLVIIGGGYIGLEVAAVARSLGLSVTVVEMRPRILERVAAPQTSDFFRSLHGEHGVTILENTGVERLVGADGAVASVVLTDGQTLAADLVLAGIGIEPCTDLARQAGLDCEDGIVVDAFCTTCDPAVFAAGDCANFEFGGERIRLESVPNAIHQAETAAENMSGGRTAYQATPWFWSDQYDVKLQIAGLNRGYDSTVVRPGKRDGAQSVWYYGGEKLLAVDAMNDAPAFMMARKIIEAGKSVPPGVARDPNVNLKEWT